MRVSILGNGLTSLALAQMLANEGISVDIFSNKRGIKYKSIQTLGISKNNIDFFNQNILKIENDYYVDRIKRLQPNTIDLDFLDENVRKNLGFIDKNERVIILNK